MCILNVDAIQCANMVQKDPTKKKWCSGYETLCDLNESMKVRLTSNNLCWGLILFHNSRFWVPFFCKPSQIIGYPSFDLPEQWKQLKDLRYPVAEQAAEMCRCPRTIWNSILACVSTKSRKSANLSNSFVRSRLQSPNRGTRQDGIFPRGCDQFPKGEEVSDSVERCGKALKSNTCLPSWQVNSNTGFACCSAYP